MFQLATDFVGFQIDENNYLTSPNKLNRREIPG